MRRLYDMWRLATISGMPASSCGTWRRFSPTSAGATSATGLTKDAEDARKVVLQGLDNYIVSEKNGQILVCKRSEEQRIREFSGE